MPWFAYVSRFIASLPSSVLTLAQAPPQADVGSPVNPVNKVPPLQGSLD